MSAELTKPQRAALAALIRCCDAPAGTSGQPAGHTYPREVALTLWPDSAAWTKRSRRHDGAAGGLGATMPMKAATMLWKLQTRGLAALSGTARWEVTAAGRQAHSGG